MFRLPFLDKPPERAYNIRCLQCMPNPSIFGGNEIDMTCFFAVLIAKILYRLGKLLGRGSSLPGQIVLKLFPNILKQIQLPATVIAVSGSNGKTSTVEMIAHILMAHGKTVAWNKEGSNQIEGVTTFLLNNCTLGGKVKADVVLLESDERYARLTFRHFVPTHFVMTNLYRDQMTRNAHSEWIYDILCDAVHDGSRLILNANDPLVSKFGYQRDNTVYFAMDENRYSTKEPRGIYHDGRYCPVCGGELHYDYFNMAHIGHFSCSGCGHRSCEPLCRITDVDLENKVLTFDHDYRITLAFASTFNAYNLLAAFTLAADLGLNKAKTAAALNGYILKSGRVLTYRLGEHNGMLLTSKHENSVSYNQSIDYVCRFGKDSTVMILVESISRKYYTGEISWLYDIDFGALNTDGVKRIVLTGQYAADLALRFSFTDIPADRLVTEPSIDRAVALLREEDGQADNYVITCFADKDKFLTRLSKSEQEGGHAA